MNIIETPNLSVNLMPGNVVGACTWRLCRSDVRLTQGGTGICDRCGAEYKVALITHLTRLPGGL